MHVHDVAHELRVPGDPAILLTDELLDRTAQAIAAIVALPRIALGAGKPLSFNVTGMPAARQSLGGKRPSRRIDSVRACENIKGTCMSRVVSIPR